LIEAEDLKKRIQKCVETKKKFTYDDLLLNDMKLTSKAIVF